MNDALRVIGVHGVPRSGTTWLGQIFNSHADVAYRFQPLFSYAFKSRLDPHSSAAQISEFFHDIYSTEDDFVLQKGEADLSKMTVRFSKSPHPTNLVYKEVRYHHILENLLLSSTDVRIVGIIRLPCAVIQSWVNAPREFKKEWNILEEWRLAAKKNQGRPEEFYGFAKWKEVAELFLRLQVSYPDRFLLVKYAELIASPMVEVQRIFGFCGLSLGDQTRKFIEASRSRDDGNPYGVFRNHTRDDKWLNRLPNQISSAIMSELRGTELEMFLET